MYSDVGKRCEEQLNYLSSIEIFQDLSSRELEEMDRQDLTEVLGTCRETIKQTLNVFKTRGLVEIGRKKVTLLDLPGLEDVAES